MTLEESTIDKRSQVLQLPFWMSLLLQWFFFFSVGGSTIPWWHWIAGAATISNNHSGHEDRLVSSAVPPGQQKRPNRRKGRTIIMASFLVFLGQSFRRGQRSTKTLVGILPSCSLPLQYSCRRHEFQQGNSPLISSLWVTALSTTTTRRALSSKSLRPHHLVIVESPSKCQTIQTILQNYGQQLNLPYDFQVTACMGHVRDLPKTKKSQSRKSKSSQAQQHQSSQEHRSTSTTTSPFPYRIAGIDLDRGRYEPQYEILPHQQARVKELQLLAADAQHVWLATDPDREGEAMAWHLTQVLKKKKKTKPNEQEDDFFRRLRFTEITSQAITQALEVGLKHKAAQTDKQQDGVIATRINPSLVQAQETRRILDRLCGFTMNPLLWKKISPGLSAGRVQSVALALAVQRERERLQFKSTAYSSIHANLTCDSMGPHGSTLSVYDKDNTNQITAYLHTINETPLAMYGSDFASQGQCLADKSRHKLHLTQSDAQSLAEFLDHADTTWTVTEIESKRRQRRPPVPYRTSTLQQDASNKLSLSISSCMKAAQQLYEQGWISYMRTDSSSLSETAEAATKLTVTDRFGASSYQSYTDASGQQGQKKKSKKQSKFAQEAHEAIRPSVNQGSDGSSLSVFVSPYDERLKELPSSCQRLYEMIYQRVVASRMPPLITNETVIHIEARRNPTDNINNKIPASDTVVARFRATGSVIVHPGYTAAYDKKSRDSDKDEFGASMPSLKEGQDLTLLDIESLNHETKPPARYTEASIVKELEALGVGRPSTYARIVQVLRERCYVGNPSNADSSPSTKRGKGRQILTGSALSAQRAAGGSAFAGASSSGQLAPSLSAFVVCELLEKHCPSYVDPRFTAQMEERLDQIASSTETSEGERIQYLDEFYGGEKGLASTIKHMEDTVDASIARRALLPALVMNASNTLTSQQHHQGKDDSDEISPIEEVGLFVGPWGPFVKKLKDGKVEEKADESKISAPLPPSMCADLSTITPHSLQAVLASNIAGGIVLGMHPEDGRPILVKTGRFGTYLQWGDDGEDGTTTHSLPREKSTIIPLTTANEEMDGDIPENEALNGQLTMDEAVGYVSLPRLVGHMDDKPIVASLGRYGPYLKVNGTYVSLKPSDGDVLTLGEETALRLIAEHKSKEPRMSKSVIADLGEMNGANISVRNGRYGPYIKWEKVNAKIPSNIDPKTISQEAAWELLEPVIAKGKQKTGSISTKSKKARKKDSNDNERSTPSPSPGPKRPRSAYLYFCAEKRPEVVKGVGKTMAAASKELARLWGETEEGDRQRYQEMAMRDKHRYEDEKRLWEESSNEEDPYETKTKMNSPRTPSPVKVKRPRSAYIFFCHEKRPQVAEKMTRWGDISKELGRLWSEEEDRQKYEDLATADKERYEKEKAELEDD